MNGHVYWRCSKHNSAEKCRAYVTTSGDQDCDTALKFGPHSGECEHNHPVEQIRFEKRFAEAILRACIKRGIEERQRRYGKPSKDGSNDSNTCDNDGGIDDDQYFASREFSTGLLDCILRYEHTWFDSDGRRCLHCGFLEPTPFWDHIISSDRLWSYGFPISCDKGRIKISLD